MQTNPIEIRKFELDVKLFDGAERKYGYHRALDGMWASLMTRASLGKKIRRQGEDAIDAVSDLIADVAPSPSMNKEELLSRSRSALHLDDAEIKRLDVDVGFADGSEIEAQEKKGFLYSWARHAELSGLP